MEYSIDSKNDYGGFSLLKTDDSGQNWRRAYVPGDDISDLPEDIQLKVQSIWTPETVAAYERHKAVNPPIIIMNPISDKLTLEERVARLEAALESKAV